MRIPHSSVLRVSRESLLARYTWCLLPLLVTAVGLVPLSAQARADNLPPKVFLLQPASGEIFTAPTEIQIAAHAEDGDGSLQSVEAMTDIGSLGVLTPNPASAGPANPYQWTWRNPPIGDHKLVVKAMDNEGATSYSESVVISVKGEEPPPTASLIIKRPADGARFAPPETVLIDVVAVDPNGDIRHVEFFANDAAIGSSDHLTKDAVIPGRPREHYLEWKPSSEGSYRMVAKATDTLGNPVESNPVAITVGPALPLIAIAATRPETAEPSANARVAPGVFTLTRTGPTADPLTVYLEYEGSATPGIDYEKLGNAVTFPPGAAAVEILLQPLEDELTEGVETVAAIVTYGIVARMPDYRIDPDKSAAKIAIHDAASSSAEALLEITGPKDGQVFSDGETILVNAVAIDPNGYISRVEFYDFEMQIGVSQIMFIRAPDPGTPIYHTFEWNSPPSGEHLLTARAVDSKGNRVVSKPVRISVEPGGGTFPVVQVGTLDAESTEFPPEVDAIDPARFWIARDGDLTKELPVYFSLHGTAKPGLDYPSPGITVVIPAGKREVTLEIVPSSDDLSERMETVAVRIEDPLPMCSVAAPVRYDIAPGGREAAAVIYDRSPSQKGGLEIALPTEGDVGRQGEPLSIIAEGYHPTLDVWHVDFYSDAELIGSSEVVFDRAIAGGLITHQIAWKDPQPGEHIITARAKLSDGSELISSEVRITVREAITSPVILDVVAADETGAELGADGTSDPAVFLIRRAGGPKDVGVTVWYAIEGSAANGVDYGQLEGTAELPAGRESVEVVIKPVLDQINEGDESVVIALQPPACPAIYPPPPWCYQIAGGGIAKAIIRDQAVNPVNLPKVTIARPVQTDAAVSIQMSGASDQVFVLESSSDLIHWTEVTPSLLPGGSVVYHEGRTNAEPYRFYRTRLP